MSSAWLHASRALWRRRERFRKSRHTVANRAVRKARAQGATAKQLAPLLKRREKWSRLLTQARNRVERRTRQIRARGDQRWGGSRYWTNRVIDIVNGRHSVSSRKRWATFGNPGSDHHRSQKLADAVDFRTAENHALKNEISRKLGGPDSLPDYGSFHVSRNGRTYRVQIIAGTHGTGPHLHVGVRRV